MIDAMPNVQAPQDRFHLVWIIFFILGLGTLLPWNFFVTASAYFGDRLKSVQIESSINGSLASNWSLAANGTQQAKETHGVLAKHYDGAMTLVSMVAIFISSVLTTLVQSTVSARVRILIGLTGNLAMFVLTAVLVWVKMLSPEDFFIITIISVFIINVFGAIFETSLFGLVSQFPTSYTTAQMSGMGISGMLTALAMIFALLGNKCRRHDITVALGRGPSQKWDALARGRWVEGVDGGFNVNCETRCSLSILQAAATTRWRSGIS
nr:equilibrative nucleoside transporter 1-like isoform X2 [Petromyzon marinus]